MCKYWLLFGTVPAPPSFPVDADDDNDEEDDMDDDEDEVVLVAEEVWYV